MGDGTDWANAERTSTADEGADERPAPSDSDVAFAPGEFDPDTFATVAQSVPVALAVLDEGGEVVSANTAFLDQFGCDREAVVGESLGQFYPGVSVGAFPGPDGESVTVQAPTDTAGGRADSGSEMRGWVELTVERRSGPEADWYVVAAHDVTDLRTRAQNREQYERIVETIDDGVYVLDDAFRIISVNDAVLDLTGYSRERLLGSSATLLASEETIAQAAAVSEALRSGENDAATITTTLRTADGEDLPVETRFSVYQFADGSYGQVGVVRDISERVRYQQTLTALHDVTRELLGAKTREAVCETVATAVTDVIDLPAAVFYLFDRDDNVLRPVTRAADCPESPSELPRVGPDDGDLWEAFVSGERRTDGSGPPLSFDGTAEIHAESGLSIPLGDHGVFFVAMDEGDRHDPDTMELVDIVAASAEAGLARVDRENRLRERDRELREQNEQLRRLRAITNVIRRVDGAVVGADSREAVETAVCDELAGSDLFSFAWIGRREDGVVRPTTWSGDGGSFLDAVDRSLEGEGGPPSVRAVRRDELAVVSTVATDLQGCEWRRAALSQDFQSAVSVPLCHSGVTYGVLTVYAPEPEAFTDRIQSVFRELGGTIADALRVVETHRWLSAGGAVELDLAIEAPDDPLVAVAREADATLVHEGTVPGEGADRTFLRVADDDVGPVRRAAAERTTVADVVVRSDGDDPLVEVHFTTPTVPTRMTDCGSRIRSLTARPDGVDATIEVAPTTGVREFVETLEETCRSVRLTARRERSEPGRDKGFRASVEDNLTDRQWEVLRAGYLSGFFDWPRTTTGEELADAFDISQPTVNRHLRVGERKLLDLLFDEE